jgi:hypothetical protein
VLGVAAVIATPVTAAIFLPWPAIVVVVGFFLALTATKTLRSNVPYLTEFALPAC